MRFLDRAVPVGSRIVCLSDVHGNRPALEAVIAKACLDDAHLVVVNGDVVNRGPRSDAVFDRLDALKNDRWVFLSGNHERYVTNHLHPRASPDGILARVHASSAWTFAQLGARARALVDWPDGIVIKAPGLSDVWVVHASLTSDDRGISPETPPEDAVERSTGELFVVGHVHRRYDFRVGQTRIVNAGSVGSACDGVREAGWVDLQAGTDGWQVTLHRVPYDLDEADRDYVRAGFIEGAGPVARLVHREWKLARPVVGPWFRAELDRVVAQEISLDRSVEAFLERVGEGA